MAPHVVQFRNPRQVQTRWVRALNRLGRLAPRAFAPDAEAWWAEARAKEPAAAEPTPEAMAALETLTASLRDDAALHFVGHISAKDDSVRLARTHLRVEWALRDQPTIAATKLPTPVFIVGWPRTGTTALHTLMAEDPRNRTLPYWESFDPVPPKSGPDRRAQRLSRMLRLLERIAPGYQAIHPMTAESAEECVALFMNHFRTLQLDIQYRAPGYVEWLLAQDAGIAYEAYRRELQLVQHFRSAGERFVLKDPTHLVHLEALRAQFPEAKIVFTHRDPARAISSICSLYAHTRAIFSNAVDPRAVGAEIMDGYWPRALEQAMELREQIPASQRVDVRHADLARDPLGTVGRAYAGLGLELHDDARAAMGRLLERRAAAPRSVHEHRAEGFGLEDAAIRERFAAYCERFDLAGDSATAALEP